MVYTTTYTLESGPDEAPNCIDIEVDYTYRGPTPNSWTEPGDPAECEIEGPSYYVNQYGEEVQLSLVLQGEEGFLESIYNDPPDDIYPEDY